MSINSDKELEEINLELARITRKNEQTIRQLNSRKANIIETKHRQELLRILQVLVVCNIHQHRTPWNGIYWQTDYDTFLEDEAEKFLPYELEQALIQSGFVTKITTLVTELFVDSMLMITDKGRNWFNRNKK